MLQVTVTKNHNCSSVSTTTTTNFLGFFFIVLFPILTTLISV
jgi:hypothetical protein